MMREGIIALLVVFMIIIVSSYSNIYGSDNVVNFSNGEVTIRHAPFMETKATDAYFEFVIVQEGATMLCKLDREYFQECEPVKYYSNLRLGEHTLVLKREGSNITPVTYEWKIIPQPTKNIQGAFSPCIELNVEGPYFIGGEDDPVAYYSYLTSCSQLKQKIKLFVDDSCGTSGIFQEGVCVLANVTKFEYIAYLEPFESTTIDVPIILSNNHIGDYPFEIKVKATFTNNEKIFYIVSSKEEISHMDPLLKIHYSFSPDVGEIVSFSVEKLFDPKNTITEYRWDFGNGGGDGGQTVDTVYNSGKTYDVTVTGLDGAGETVAKDTTSIFVFDPQVEFDAYYDDYDYERIPFDVYNTSSLIKEYAIPLIISPFALIYLLRNPIEEHKDLPKYIFERFPQKFRLNNIVVIIGVFLALGIIPLLFFLFDYTISPYLLPLTLIDPPGLVIWLGIFVGSIYYAKLYRSEYFKSLDIWKLGPHASELIKNSFLGKKSFILFLVIFEIMLATSFLFGFLFQSNLDYAQFLSMYVPLSIMVVPLLSIICSTFWSSLISFREVIEQSSLDTLDVDMDAKIKTRTSRMTRHFAVWLLFVIVPGSLVYGYFIPLTMVFLFCMGVSLVVVEIRNRKYISKVKENIKGELEESEKYYRSELEDEFDDEDEINASVKAYQKNILQTIGHVENMPNSLFNKGSTIILLSLLFGMPAILILFEVIKYSY